MMRKIKGWRKSNMCKEYDIEELDIIPPKKTKEAKIIIGKETELYESDDKMVSHPEHYQSENGFEVIDVIEAFTKDLKGIEAVDTGKIIKYACRWHKKNGIQDLEKILWCTSHLIKKLKEKQ